MPQCSVHNTPCKVPTEVSVNLLWNWGDEKKQKKEWAKLEKQGLMKFISPFPSITLVKDLCSNRRIFWQRIWNSSVKGNLKNHYESLTLILNKIRPKPSQGSPKILWLHCCDWADTIYSLCKETRQLFLSFNRVVKVHFKRKKKRGGKIWWRCVMLCQDVGFGALIQHRGRQPPHFFLYIKKKSHLLNHNI